MFPWQTKSTLFIFRKVSIFQRIHIALPTTPPDRFARATTPHNLHDASLRNSVSAPQRPNAYRSASDRDSNSQGKTDLQGQLHCTTATATYPCNSVLAQNGKMPTEALPTGIPTHKAKQICKDNHLTQPPLPYLCAILFWHKTARYQQKPFRRGFQLAWQNRFAGEKATTLRRKRNAVLFFQGGRICLTLPETMAEILAINKDRLPFAIKNTVLHKKQKNIISIFCFF